MDTHDIEALMEEAGKDSAWLAKICGVEEAVVSGWLSKKEIPEPVTVQIKILMKEEDTVTVDFTLEEYLMMEIEAEEAGISIKALIIRRLKEGLKGGLQPPIEETEP